MACDGEHGRPVLAAVPHQPDTRVEWLASAPIWPGMRAQPAGLVNAPLKCPRERWPEHEPELDIALNTGLRCGGMYKLTWGDIDFERRLATERLGKNGKTRHLPLNEAALAAFGKLRDGSDGAGRVFFTKKPRHWFEKAIKRAGIEDFHWHDLRHTFASRLTMLGVPLRVVQKLMGHSSIQMTARYSHLAPGFEQAAVEQLADFGKPAGQGLANPNSPEPTGTKTGTGLGSSSFQRSGLGLATPSVVR